MDKPKNSRRTFFGRLGYFLPLRFQLLATLVAAIFSTLFSVVGPCASRSRRNSNGSIVEHGTHEELLARGGVYSDLYERQFSGRLREEVLA